MSVLRQALLVAAQDLSDLRSDDALLEGIDTAIAWITDAFRAGNKIIAAGNGGSLADAMHLCEEFTGRFRKDRKPYPALCLSDPTHLTCVGNDYGFDEVFSRGIEAFAKPGDVVVLLSTSGNSKNLLTAARSARLTEAKIVGFLGRGGGELAGLCDLSLVFPGKTSDRIQELHMLTLHALIEAVEANLGHV
ncbi:MAG TPA: SIS domain-containing protein [Fimbriimonadaceae bacterium]|mgnify:CR=1 FL=1|nr:SIS domain-containing protein [Fimbriimonadaceae bacterium]